LPSVYAPDELAPDMRCAGRIPSLLTVGLIAVAGTRLSRGAEMAARLIAVYPRARNAASARWVLDRGTAPESTVRLGGNKHCAEGSLSTRSWSLAMRSPLAARSGDWALEK
jgi:hypothetical protein